VNIKDIYSPEEADLLSDCRLCPRECRVNRFEGGLGYCGTDAGLNIASICIHRGEEPPISGPHGICNIFFTGCNLRCIYCQNHDISQPEIRYKNPQTDPGTVLDRIEEILSHGINSVGFVSPSHVVPQVSAIIRGLGRRGINPITVYNTNSYDKTDTLRKIADVIDVYLPDYKYFTNTVASSFSDACDYPEVALKALREMYFQKGSVLVRNNNGMAERGILIRHLVLPGYAEESKKVLRSIAGELSPGVSISLMSQYYPAHLAKSHPELGRSLYRSEYESVTDEMEKLGFRNGWIQDPESCNSYLPDFTRDQPFG
jgi:putative pyruvate formate lyase activating enzyme